jgi:hypothetical protein
VSPWYDGRRIVSPPVCGWIHGVRKHDQSIYLACIGWIIVDAAIVIGIIVRQYEELLSQPAS